ncbi:hypothetical protein F2Q68_00035667 [Brassica cretica]|uniref:Uncharacterized protein n=1 Tax=Brassica cretica TaxID=69181 RepID=A0A8S9H3Z1_BRACR|nr:hypothetical protein F2Q68_00035667 [Brassica cretica]
MLCVFFALHCSTATVILTLPHESEIESVIVFTYVSILPDGFDIAQCAQNFKLSDSSLPIRFNDSTNFDELIEPVSPLPEERFRIRNQTDLVGLSNTSHSFQYLSFCLIGMCSEILGKMSTKKDGKTVKEAHEKLKGNRISSSGIKENNSNSLSGSTSVNIDSTANTSSTLSPLCEDADSGNQDGWIHGNRVKENDSQRLVGVPALDASFENQLARYQNLPNNPLLTQTNPFNAGLMSVEGHLRSPLQNQVNWQIPVQDSLLLQKWPMNYHGTDLALHENFGTFSSLIGSQNQQQPIGSSFQAPFSRTWTSRLIQGERAVGRAYLNMPCWWESPTKLDGCGRRIKTSLHGIAVARLLVYTTTYQETRAA